MLQFAKGARADTLLPRVRFAPAMVVPSEAEALAFLERGALPPGVTKAAAFARACVQVPAFKAKAWPHFACFVDASNVARRRPVPAHEVNTPRGRLADLDAVVAALKALRYVPVVVSDASLFYAIDDPYGWQEKYGKYPHSVARGQQADSVVLRALRSLPEAACVTNDRFSKPDELRDYPDVLAEPGRFFRHQWDGDAPRLVSREGAAMPDAFARMAERLSLRQGNPS